MIARYVGVALAAALCVLVVQSQTRGDPANHNRNGAQTAVGSRQQVIDVVATGVGSNPDDAVQNAFSNAIEQAVGVLVDVETLVKHDELLTDDVLKFSRGLVQHYEVVKRWKEEGLHYARIRAKVSMAKLSARLKASNISVRSVAGKRFYEAVKSRLAARETAAAAMERAMQDYSMEKLVKAEIVSEGEPITEDVQTWLSLVVKLEADQEAWKKFHDRLYAILDGAALDKTEVRSKRQYESDKGFRALHFEPYDEQRIGMGLTSQSRLVCLLKKISKSATVTTWDVFLIPEPVESVLRQAIQAKLGTGVFCLDFLDSSGSPLLSVRRPLSEKISDVEFYNMHDACGKYLNTTGIWISNCFWLNGASYARTVYFQEMCAIELDKIKDVQSWAVYVIEDETLAEGGASAFGPFGRVVEPPQGYVPEPRPMGPMPAGPPGLPSPRRSRRIR